LVSSPPNAHTSHVWVRKKISYAQRGQIELD
jgi:hypothetical protein